MPLVNVKVNLVGLNPSVEQKLCDLPLSNKFLSKSSIENIIMYFQDLIAEEIDYGLMYNDVFMLNRSVMDDLQKSLSDFGINNGSLLIRIHCKNQVDNKSTDNEKQIKAPDKTDLQQIPEKNDLPIKDNELINQPCFEIFKPNPDSIDPLSSSIDYSDDQRTTPTVEELKKYQQLLKNQADMKSEYVMKKLKLEKEKAREKRNHSEHQQVIKPIQEEIHIRMKFPDLTVTLVKLPSIQKISSKTTLVKDFIQFLNDTLLISNDLKYNLIIPRFSYTSLNKGKIQEERSNNFSSSCRRNPSSIYYTDILSNADILRRDLSQYHLVNFIFEIIIPGKDILSNRLCYKIDSLNKGPFVKISQPVQSINKLIDHDANVGIENNVTSQSTNGEQSESSTAKKSTSSKVWEKDSLNLEKKVPKWFKLNKK